MNKKETCLAMEGAISMALAGSPTLQWGFEGICKENAELKKENAELIETNSRTLSQLNLTNGELIIENENLKKENAELRSIAEFQQGSNMDRHFKNKTLRERLSKAVEVMEGLMRFCRCFAQHHTEDIRYKQAEQFLKEMRE